MSTCTPTRDWLCEALTIVVLIGLVLSFLSGALPLLRQAIPNLPPPQHTKQ